MPRLSLAAIRILACGRQDRLQESSLGEPAVSGENRAGGTDRVAVEARRLAVHLPSAYGPKRGKASTGRDTSGNLTGVIPSSDAPRRSRLLPRGAPARLAHVRDQHPAALGIARRFGADRLPALPHRRRARGLVAGRGERDPRPLRSLPRGAGRRRGRRRIAGRRRAPRAGGRADLELVGNLPRVLREFSGLAWKDPLDRRRRRAHDGARDVRLRHPLRRARPPGRELSRHRGRARRLLLDASPAASARCSRDCTPGGRRRPGPRSSDGASSWRRSSASRSSSRTSCSTGPRTSAAGAVTCRRRGSTSTASRGATWSIPRRHRCAPWPTGSRPGSRRPLPRPRLPRHDRSGARALPALLSLARAVGARLARPRPSRPRVSDRRAARLPRSALWSVALRSLLVVGNPGMMRRFYDATGQRRPVPGATPGRDRLISVHIPPAATYEGASGACRRGISTRPMNRTGRDLQ